MEEGCKNSCTEDTSPEILLTEIYPGDSENLESVEIIHSENLQEPDQSQFLPIGRLIHPKTGKW